MNPIIIFGPYIQAQIAIYMALCDQSTLIFSQGSQSPTVMNSCSKTSTTTHNIL